MCSEYFNRIFIVSYVSVIRTEFGNRKLGSIRYMLYACVKIYKIFENFQIDFSSNFIHK